MCGIFGSISQQSIPRFEIDLLTLTNAGRGDRSSGFIFQDDRTLTIVRAADRVLSPRLFGTSVLGHVRAPTSGVADHIAGCHPFSRDHLHLAMNGILLRVPGYELDSTKVDTEVLLDAICDENDRQPTLREALETVLSQCEGQQACWLLDETTNRLYLWRVMSPLFFATRPNELVFSSTQIPEGGLESMREGYIDEYDFTTAAWLSHSPFKYVSIHEGAS